MGAKKCDPVKDHYKLNANVKTRCNKELCAFICKEGQVLNKGVSHIYCLPNGESPQWFPSVDGEIKCVDQKEADENKENDKKCTPLQNSIDSDVKVSCNKGVCMFKCEDGTASVASATCFNGKWNINSKVEIKCEGKTTTTKKATTTTTAPPTTTTEEVCGKKCQKQKEKEQKEKDKENNNGGEEECDKKCQKKKKKEQQKEDKKKDKENKKNKDKGKDKDKGKKDKDKKKNKNKKELGDYDTIYDDIDDATTTTD